MKSATCYVLALVSSMSFHTAFGQDRRLMVTSSSSLSSIGSEVGLNNKGTIAFTANDSGGSAAFTVDEAGVVTKHTFQGATRSFGTSAAINDQTPPQIAVRDRVSGSPASWLIRKWQANGSLAWTKIGSSLDGNFDSASFRADINNSGTVAFSAAVAGSTSTTLFAGPIQASLVPLATYSGTLGLYPQISDDDVVVVQDNQNRIVTYTYPSGAVEVVAGLSSAFSDTGRAPGIAPSSKIVAFSGIRSAGEGLFLGIKGSTGRSVYRLAGEGADGLLDLDFDQRVGVTSNGSLPDGLQIAVVFRGINNGVQGIHAIGATATETGGVITLKTGPPVLILAEGSATAFTLPTGLETTKTVTTATLYDPINPRRQIALHAAFSDGTTGIIRVDPCPLPTLSPPAYQRFKQFDVSGCLVGGLSPCPSSVGSFSSYGCMISAFATGIDKIARDAGFPLTGFSARSLQQWMSTKNLQSATNGRIDIATAYYETPPSPPFSALRVEGMRASGSSHFVFDDLIEELEGSRPVILGVPSMSNSATETDHLLGRKLHYVVALEYDKGLGMLYGRSAGVLINDPGYGASRYSIVAGNYTRGYADVPDKTGATTNFSRIGMVTLHDYFAALTRTGGSSAPAAEQLKGDYLGWYGDDLMRDSLRVEEWFNSSNIYQRGSGFETIPMGGTPSDLSNFRRKLITKLTSSYSGLLASLAPVIQVASPVELVLTDQITGQRYVTSSFLLQSGDILLEKRPTDLISPADTEDTQIIDPIFLPYSITLPLVAYGHSLSVSIVGVGNGGYEILYQNRDSIFTPPASISGTISNGGTYSSAFVVQPAAAPSVIITSFTKLAGNQYKIDWVPAASVTVQFSESMLEGSWQNIDTVLVGTSWTGSPPAPVPSRGFFRLSQP